MQRYSDSLTHFPSSDTLFNSLYLLLLFFSSFSECCWYSICIHLHVILTCMHTPTYAVSFPTLHTCKRLCAPAENEATQHVKRAERWWYLRELIYSAGVCFTLRDTHRCIKMPIHTDTDAFQHNNLFNLKKGDSYWIPPSTQNNTTPSNAHMYP